MAAWIIVELKAYIILLNFAQVLQKGVWKWLLPSVIARSMCTDTATALLSFSFLDVTHIPKYISRGIFRKLQVLDQAA